MSSPKNPERWAIYTAMGGRDLRVGEWNNGRQWSMEVGRRLSDVVKRHYIYKINLLEQIVGKVRLVFY